MYFQKGKVVISRSGVSCGPFGFCNGLNAWKPICEHDFAKNSFGYR